VVISCGLIVKLAIAVTMLPHLPNHDSQAPESASWRPAAQLMGLPQKETWAVRRWVNMARGELLCSQVPGRFAFLNGLSPIAIPFFSSRPSLIL
jgi:hypothetical protein